MRQIIQPARRDREELKRLLRIWQSSVQATHLFLQPDDMKALQPVVKQALQSVGGLYVCQAEDNIIGFAGVDERKIEMLFVHADARGCGAGKQLLCYAINNLGARYVDVNEQNAQAVGFYEHMGFKCTGRSQLDGQGRALPLLHMALDQ